jgi:hypothetical protein
LRRNIRFWQSKKFIAAIDHIARVYGKSMENTLRKKELQIQNINKCLFFKIRRWSRHEILNSSPSFLNKEALLKPTPYTLKG